jgi:hypothetical protein
MVLVEVGVHLRLAQLEFLTLARAAMELIQVSLDHL